MEKTLTTGLSMANLTVSPNFSKVYGIPLRPGDLFIMNPGVIHAVVTKGNSFANGIDFPLAETLKQSLSLAQLDAEDNRLKNDVRDGPKLYNEVLVVLNSF